MKKGLSFKQAKTAIYVLFPLFICLPLLLGVILRLHLAAAIAAFVIFAALFFVGFRYLRCPHCGKRVTSVEPLLHKGCKCPGCGKKYD